MSNQKIMDFFLFRVSIICYIWKVVLGYPIGEPEDGFEFKYWE